MSTSYLMLILANLAYRAPALIVLAAGIILALARMKRHPGVSILACIAFVLLSLTTVSGSLTYSIVPLLMNQTGSSISDINNLTIISNIILTIINIAAWILILFAILHGRKRSSIFSPVDSTVDQPA